MSNTEAVVYYKRLCKALLSKPDRVALQQCLTTFVKTKSFAALANDIPRILNTPRKRAIVPAIRGLIPEVYHSQFDRSLQHLGTSQWTTIEKEDASHVRKEREKRESELEQAAKRMAGMNSSSGNGFEDFLMQQRMLSRGVDPMSGVSGDGKWGLMENTDTVSSLEFTDEDEILYADVEDIMEEDAPAIPPRYHHVDIAPPSNDSHLPPIPPRKSASTSVSPNPTPSHTPVPSTRTTRPASPHKLWLPEWYNVGPYNRQEAEVELKKHGFTEGLFLIRDKGAGGVKYCLSVVWNQSVRHVLLDRKTYREPFLIDGKNYGNCYSPEEMVETLRELGSRFEYTLVKPLRAPTNQLGRVKKNKLGL